MADNQSQKFSDLTPLTDPVALDDFIHIVDKSDTTQSPEGSSKKVEITALKTKINEGDLSSDGSVPMDAGYTPSADQDISTKKYVDDADAVVTAGYIAADALLQSEITAKQSQLEKITEGANTGWRLLGVDELNYGDIGGNAVDFSIQDAGNTTNGATGTTAYAEGKNTTASGNLGSHAEGSGTTAGGDYSHAEGFDTKANGDGAHAEGYDTKAYGDGSHAEGGYSTGAYSKYSHIEGYQTQAGVDNGNTASSGRYAHAEGNNTFAKNESSHAEGQFNIGSSDDTIHETGIGTGTSAKKNAFEIYLNGVVTAPELTESLIDDPTSTGNFDGDADKVLVTKEWVDTKVAAHKTDITVSWTQDFNLLSGNYLNFGAMIGADDNGFVLGKSYDVVDLSWSIVDFPKYGEFSFTNNTSTTVPRPVLGTIQIGATGSGNTPLQGSVSAADGDFAAFTLPINTKLGLFWQALDGGNAPQWVTVSAILREV